MKNKILIFVREAGGAAAVAPVCTALLKRNHELLVLAKDKACNVFEKHGLDYVFFPEFSKDWVEDIAREKWNSLPDIVFTSASTLPENDMTDRMLWKWACEKKLPSIGIVEQWQNYARRFSGRTENEKLAYMPDYIFTMDELAKREMIADGIPENKIIITGQPAFDAIKEEQAKFSQKGKELKEKIGIKKECLVVTFVAEQLRRTFGDTLGYDEQSALEFLGDALESFRDEVPEIFLIIKLHPENTYDEFKWSLGKWKSLKVKIIGSEFRPQEVIAVSDIVTGMSSVMLLEAIIASKPTVSMQINSKIESQLAATKSGAIPFIKEAERLKKLLHSLLTDEKAKKAYLEKQITWPVAGKAVPNCVREIEKIINTGR